MALYVNNNPTSAPIGAVSLGGNNTTPSVRTEQVRVDRIKATQPEFRGTQPVGELKGTFANAGTVNHPTVKSNFTQEELCGGTVLAQFIDLMA